MKSEGWLPRSFTGMVCQGDGNLFLPKRKRPLAGMKWVEDGLSDKSVISWWRSWCTDTAVHKSYSCWYENDNLPGILICIWFWLWAKIWFLEEKYDMDVGCLLDCRIHRNHSVWGVQCNVWTEWIPTMERMEYMVFRVWWRWVRLLGEKSRLNDYKTFEQREWIRWNALTSWVWIIGFLIWQVLWS